MTNLHANNYRKLSNAFINVSTFVLVAGSIVKFLHPAKAAAYMAFLGYQRDKLFVIAAIELITGVLFAVRRTRPLGLLLLSSYLGGAVAAHIAYHPLNGSAPIILFSFNHHYLAALPAAIVIALAWSGVWLSQGAPWWLPSTQDNLESRAIGKDEPNKIALAGRHLPSLS